MLLMEKKYLCILMEGNMERGRDILVVGESKKA